MMQMIDELKSIPGVVGACVYSTRAGLRASNLPTIFKPERLAAIGKQLSKLYSAGKMSFSDLNNVSLHYDESIVIVRELQKGLLIFVICDPSLNQNLLVMSLNLLQDEFEGSEVAPVPSLTTQPPSAEVAAQPPPVQTDERLSALCSEIKSLLGKILGPMAGYVFDESFADWQKQGDVDIDHIDTLIDMLNREIADTDKIEHFQKLIVPKLNDFRKG